MRYFNRIVGSDVIVECFPLIGVGKVLSHRLERKHHHCHCCYQSAQRLAEIMFFHLVSRFCLIGMLILNNVLGWHKNMSMPPKNVVRSQIYFFFSAFAFSAECSPDVKPYMSMSFAFL